jgi:ArsR family transcriptional regulator
MERMVARRPALPVLDPAVACCTPLAEAPLSRSEATDMARRLKALADPARLRLLSILLAAPGGEACTCDLTEPLGLSQPTVSHHLKKLAESGLVTGERRGVWTYYRVDRDALSAAARMLEPASSPL